MNVLAVKNKLLRVILFLSIIIFVFLIVILVFNYVVVPLKPKNAYFIPPSSRIARTEIELAKFQPIYLLSFKKDGGYYYKCVYRDSNGSIKFVDVFLGGFLQGEYYEMAYLKVEDEGKKIESEGYSRIFNFGEQIGVEYFTSSNLGNLSPESFEEFVCKKNINVCLIINFIKSQDGELIYQKFSESQGNYAVKIVPALRIYRL